jgi:chromosome segregation ATPase
MKISRCDPMKIPRAAMMPYLLAGLVAALLPLPASAGIKCWTNDEGVRECGNAIPPKYAQKAYREINEEGITVSTTERAKTKEELRTERQEAARLEAIRAEEAAKIRERKSRDRVLLSTFTTEQELTIAHEGQVAAIDIRIGHTNRILKQLERSLGQLRAQAATLERRGKPITPELESKIATTERQIQDSNSYIEKRRLQKAELAAQFTEDRARYRQLKGIK